MGAFDHLIPKKPNAKSGMFSHLIPGGKPEKTESLLLRAMRGGPGDVGSLMGMSEKEVQSQAMQNRESILPMLGQTIGGTATGFLGAPLLGSTAGATAGQAANQAIRAIPGQRFIPEGDPSLEDIKGEAIRTGLTEAAFRGPGAAIFRRARIGERLSKAGIALGELKKKLAQIYYSKTGLKAGWFQQGINKAISSVDVPFGPTATMLKKWKRFFKDMPENTPVSARTLEEFRDDIGGSVAWGKNKAGARVQMDIDKPALNEAGQELYRVASGRQKEIATKAGIKEFVPLQKEVSGLMKKMPSGDPTKGGSMLDMLARSGAIGGLGYAATHSIPLSALLTGGGMMLSKPNVRNALFRAIEKTGIGRGLTLATTEEIRKAS